MNRTETQILMTPHKRGLSHRNRHILMEFSQLIEVGGMRSEIVRNLAKKNRISERWIYNILKNNGGSNV